MASLDISSRLSRRLRARRKRLRERNKEEKQTSTLVVVALSLFVPALLALVLYACVEGWEPIAVGLLTATAAFAAGALLGFLFGIPRTLATADVPTVGGDKGSPHPVYGTNTNLEQISDWLTKILVGVGLVQVGKIGGAVNDLASGIEGGLGDNGHAVAVMLLVSFSIAGFLTSYLYTRMRLQSALEPGRELIEERERDLTNALPLVRSQLDPSGEEDPGVVELSEALYVASPGIRDEAFYLARNQRRANWRGVSADEDKGLVALVIPVFEALIGLDKEKKYHRNHGELGFALKDQERPDYEAARTRLTEAIEMRGDRLAARFPMYEFNRAFCEILLDRAFNLGAMSAPAVAEKIRADLAVALGTENGRRAFEKTAGNDAATVIEVWQELNPR